MRLPALLRDHPRELGFGFLHGLASSAGQTYVISLYLPGIKQSFAIGDTTVASLYAIATIASGALLWIAGRWIDRVDLLRYSLVSGAFLACACLFTAAATLVPLLAVGFFTLRLGGQGLLTHVGVTAVARYFNRSRGMALSLTSMGHPLGEAVLPVVVVTLIGAWGWRPVMAATGLFSLLLVIAAGALVRGNAAFRMPQVPATQPVPAAADPAAVATPKRFLLSGYFLLSAPLFMANSMFITALVFHQASIAEARGYTLEWFAVSFIAFALARVAGALLAGPIVDRYGASRLFSLHLVPLCLGIAVLSAGSSAWIVPVYWVLAGFTSGMSATLQAAIVAEHVPAHRLGSVRSVLATLSVLASAAGPVAYAALGSAGLSMAAVLWGSIATMLAATLMGIFAAHRWPLKRQMTHTR